MSKTIVNIVSNKKGVNLNEKYYIYLFLCIVLLLLAFSGCSKRAGKIDVDGDKVSIQGSDGKEAIVTSKTEWPDSELIKNVPEFTKGSVASTVEMDEVVIVILEKVKSKDFDSYLEKIKETMNITVTKAAQ